MRLACIKSEESGSKTVIFTDIVAPDILYYPFVLDP
jgi:hypothetical protein